MGDGFGQTSSHKPQEKSCGFSFGKYIVCIKMSTDKFLAQNISLYVELNLYWEEYL
jgi:hypothetical protein